MLILHTHTDLSSGKVKLLLFRKAKIFGRRNTMDWKLEYEITRKTIVSSIESLRTALTAQENFLKILDRNYNERKEIEALQIEKQKPYTVQQVAEQLNVDRQTIYKAVKDGILKARHIRGSIRIYPEDLNNYINQC